MNKNAQESKRIKQAYLGYSDQMLRKRFASPFALRRYVHRQIFESVLKHIPKTALVADVGCGEGVLSMLMAKRGARVFAMDVSKANLKTAKDLAEREGVSHRVRFLLADAERIPLKDKSVDLVVSSHVLEHLPDFDRGLNELVRIARGKIIVALPTCLNWCAVPLLGGGNYWKWSFVSPLHLLRGVLRIMLNLHREGVDERYMGMDLPHIWRYPWATLKKFNRAGLSLSLIEASTLAPPYLLTYLPSLEGIYKFIDKTTRWKVLKYLGYGTTYVLEKKRKPL